LPGLQVARADPSDALREGALRGATAGTARAASRVLVMSEVALAVMLVAAAGLTIKSLQRITRQDLGLATDNVLTFAVTIPASGFVPNLPDENSRVKRFFESFEERLRALPGTTSVGAINMLPIAQTGTNGQVYLRDRQLKREEAPIAEFRVVSPSYMQTVGMTLITGRFIDQRDTADTGNVVVINETLARMLWPGQPPANVLGQFMGTGFDDGKTFREVIGVVRDVRSRSVQLPPDAETYVPLAQYPLPTMVFTVKSATRADTLVPLVRSALADLDPRLALATPRTFEDVLAAATRSSRLYSALTALFGVLAGALAIVGIYSVMSYTVAQRTRELAIRSALGASNQGLLGLVLREGFVMTGVGILVGVAGALAASRLLQVLLYEVSPTDPVVLGGTALGVTGAALLGYLVPALRASRVQPAAALRAE
jgi:putative ABC transport system permease protein